MHLSPPGTFRRSSRPTLIMDRLEPRTLLALATAIDQVIFGNTTSESAHAFTSVRSQTIAGGLSQTARQLLPLTTLAVDGGSMTFNLAVDPTQRNYFTVKLWGNDDTDMGKGRLYLYAPVNGTDYQVGYRHEGDYTPLSVTASKSPLPNRFFYSTTMLPLSMTRGKTSITLKIQSTGELYGLGSGGPETSGNYQMYMDTASRGIYRAYTHTQPALDVSAETQGTAPTTSARPSVTAASILGATGTYTTGLKNWVTGKLSAALTTFTVSDVQLLANSYNVSVFAWSAAQKTQIVNKVIAALDGYASDYYTNPSTSVTGSSGYGAAIGNASWGGAFGTLGWAIHLLSGVSEFASQVDTTVNYGAAGGNKTRRQAWGDMLVASRDSGRFNRRTLTNQAILGDLNIYKANRTLLDLADARAFTETEGQRYLKESAGLMPWAGNDLPEGGSEWPWGHDYYQVTPDGITREWGLSGSYAEMSVHVAMMYRFTGNTAFRDQAVKMAKAMAYLRRPAVEVSGASNYRTMERIGLLAWRGVREADGYFANDLSYSGPASWSAGMIVAGATLDPAVVGYAKQMLTDNQYLNNLVADTRYYSSLSFDALYAFEPYTDYYAVVAAADSGTRLPMTAGEADFAWSDELSGVIAIKKGNDRLWISDYWQAKTGTGVNGLARFHYSTASYDQYGTMETNPQFDSDGSYFVRQNLIDLPERTLYSPANPPTQAFAGEMLPIALPPADSVDDTPYRGKINFGAFRFGNYLIGTNSPASLATYALNTPAGFTSAIDLTTNTLKSGAIAVAPNSTTILYLSDGFDAAPVPTVPLLLRASGTTGGITLNWTAASGATTYTLKRAATENGTYTTLASNLTGTSYVDTTVTSRAAYHYVVIAVNANGESYPSVDAAASSGLPVGWTNTDIGTVALTGSARHEDGRFVLTGSGSDIGGNADSLQFAYRQLSGDGSITVRLAGITMTGGLDKVGLMMRSSAASGSRQFSALLDLQLNAVRTPYRSSTNGGTSWITSSNYSAAPTWLRIVRAGNVFTGYASVDGTTWTQIGSTTLAMGTTVLAGLAACARTTDGVNAATFDSLTFSASVTSIAVTPNSGTVQPSATQPFQATALDIFGAPVMSSFVWSASRGAVSPSGVFTAPTTSGPVTITATSGSVSTSVTLSVALLTTAVNYVFQSLPQRIEVDFSGNVAGQLDPTDFSLHRVSPALTIAPSAMSVQVLGQKGIITFPGMDGGVLPNGDYQFTLNAGAVTDTSGTPLFNSTTTTFFSLAGDINRDRAVDFGDLLILAQNYGASGQSYAQGNINGDANGNVDFDDLLMLSQNYGASLLLAQPPGVKGRKAAQRPMVS